MMSIVFQPKIEEIEERMMEREREIKKMEEKSNAVADDVSVVQLFIFYVFLGHE